MDLSDSRISELAQLFKVSEDFVYNASLYYDNEKDIQKMLYENEELAKEKNVPEQVMEHLQIMKVQLEQETGHDIDFGNIIPLRLMESNHNCIFENESIKPCNICPLNFENKLQMVFTSIRESNLEINSETVQYCLNKFNEFISDNKEMIVNDILEYIKNHKNKD